MSRALVLTALAAALACGSSDEAKPPPTVTLRALPVELLASDLTFVVEVAGCDEVLDVAILSGAQILAQDTPQGAATTLTAKIDAIDYRRLGLAADLLLHAEATCTDGRAGRSKDVATTFLPVSLVLPGPWSFENYWVEEAGATFLGCEGDLVRHNRNRSVAGRVALGLFACDLDTQLVFGPDGTRFLVKPDVGAVAVSKDLRKLWATGMQGLVYLAAYSGQVVLAGSNAAGTVRELKALSATTGTGWSLAPEGTPYGNPVKDGSGQILLPSAVIVSGTPVLQVERYSATAGVKGTTQSLVTLSNAPGTPIPEVAIHPAGHTAYLSDLGEPAVVSACNLTQSGLCTAGQARTWESPPLAGAVTQVVATADAVLALGETRAYFLDPASGVPLGVPVTPPGGFVFVAGVPGADGSFHLLAMAPGRSGIKGIVVFASPGVEVMRVGTNGAGWIVDVDPDGVGWLLGDDLVRLQSAGWYGARR